MTDSRMALIERVDQQADGDLVRAMRAFAAERIMKAEVEVRTGATKDARTPMREVRRNGRRDRGWDSRAGRVALEIPRLRKGGCFPGFLEPRRTAEKALVAVMQEACVHGVSARGGRALRALHRSKQTTGLFRPGRPVSLGKGEGHGRRRHVEAPGRPPLRPDRRAGERVPDPTA